MNELLAKYIANKEAEKRKQKDEFLISQGLCQKVYSENTTYTKDFPESEWDERTQRLKFYKYSPIEVTDEEYQRVLVLSKPTQAIPEDEANGVAIALKVIAILIFICGFFAGLILGFSDNSGYSSEEFSITIAFIIWTISFIDGIFVLGFSEIINLLHKINNK